MARWFLGFPQGGGFIVPERNMTSMGVRTRWGMNVGQGPVPVPVYLLLVLKASLSFPIVYAVLYAVAFFFCFIFFGVPPCSHLSYFAATNLRQCTVPAPSPLPLVARYVFPSALLQVLLVATSDISLNVLPLASSPWRRCLASPESFLVCSIFILCRDPVESFESLCNSAVLHFVLPVKCYSTALLEQICDFCTILQIRLHNVSFY